MLTIEQIDEMLREATPGPWRQNTTLQCYVHSNKCYICSTQNIGHFEEGANARLIAAAPDLAAQARLVPQLVEALRAIVARADEPIWGEDWEVGAAYGDMEALARAALAKVETDNG